MESRILKKGSILFHEGEKSTEMYYIESGLVAILCKEQGGEENIPVNIIGKGNFVGEFAFFDQNPRSATVMCVQDTTLKVIDQQVMQSIGKNGIFIIRTLVNKMRSMNEIFTAKEDNNKAA